MDKFVSEEIKDKAIKAIKIVNELRGENYDRVPLFPTKYVKEIERVLVINKGYEPIYNLYVDQPITINAHIDMSIVNDYGSTERLSRIDSFAAKMVENTKKEIATFLKEEPTSQRYKGIIYHNSNDIGFDPVKDAYEKEQLNRLLAQDILYKYVVKKDLFERDALYEILCGIATFHPANFGRESVNEYNYWGEYVDYLLNNDENGRNEIVTPKPKSPECNPVFV